MKCLILSIAIFISLQVKAEEFRLSPEDENLQSVHYYCAASDRFIVYAALAAIHGKDDTSVEMTEWAGEPLLLSKQEVMGVISKMERNLDVANAYSSGFDSSRECYASPKKWIVNFDKLEKNGLLRDIKR